jgi:hypothetical protein
VLHEAEIHNLTVLQGSWGVRRIAKAGQAEIKNPTGALYIITLRIKGTPQIAGISPRVGHSLYLKRPFFLIQPEVDCLLLAPDN